MSERMAWRLALGVVLLACALTTVRWWAEPSSLVGDGAEVLWRKYTAVVCGVLALAALAITSPVPRRGG